jgi:predicted Fe-S protein YdhL (DUF1289 family)
MPNREPPVVSPCVRVCVLGDDGVCRDGYRSSDEIMAWSTANNEQRRQFVLNAEARFLANQQEGH